MSKQITLPLGLDISDVDVGDLSLVIGRVYNVNSVSLNSVREAFMPFQIDTSIIDFSRLRTNIASWAAFKPTKDSNNPSGMGLSNNLLFYDRPSTNNNVFLLDWAGYNHNAPIPNISPTSINIGYNNRSHGSNEVITRNIIVNLPEFDVREFNPNATQMIAYSRSMDRSHSFTYYNAVTITSTHLTNRQVNLDYRVLSPSSGDVEFRVEVWVGHSTSTLLYRFPNSTLNGNLMDGGSTSDSTLEIDPDEFYPDTHQLVSSSFSVLTQSSVSWTTTASESWISMPPQFGTGNGTVFFDLMTYDVSGVQFRGGFITVEGTGVDSGLVKQFIIIQASADAFNQGYTGGGATGNDCSGGFDPNQYIDCIILNLQSTYDIGT